VAFEQLYSAKSDTGLKRRHNEDHFVADPSLGLYVVCDGMGGGNAGGIASALDPASFTATSRTFVDRALARWQRDRK